VTNAKGLTEFAVSNVLTPNADVSDRDYFIRLRDNPNAGLLITEPMMGRLLHKPIILLARRRAAPDGSFAGIVHVSITIDSLSAAFSAVDLGPHGVVSLWDSKPSLLARHGLQQTTEMAPSSTFIENVRSYRNPIAYHTRSGVDGIQRMFFLRKVSRWPLYLVVGIADEDFLAGWYRQAAYLGGLAILFLLVTVTASAINLRDLRRRKRAEITVQEAELRYRTLAAGTFEGIVVMEDGRIVDANEQYLKMLGYRRDEIIGQMADSVMSPEARVRVLPAIQQGRELISEHAMARKDGTPMIVETHGQTMDIQGRTVRLTAMRDITLLKNQQGQLEHIAHHDILTNLPNRVLLLDRLEQALLRCQRRQTSLAVAYVDLDGFKTVNDRYGREVGDTLLVAIAHHMKSALRDEDTLARIGGDEFVAILADLERPQDCNAVLNRLLATAADPVRLGDRTLQMSASIGVTLYPQDGADADQLLRHADQAMYLAKQSGRKRYHMFDVAQDAAAKARHETVEGIRQAFEGQEFVLFYQPKVNMRTGEVIGVEALIRWQHPERGLLPPSAFLPIIEDDPIGVDLGDWVIEEALAQIGQWQTDGLDLPVSVNVSPHQLQEADFVARLRRSLAANASTAPRSLELEIVETGTLQDVAVVVDIMRACRGLGVGFALDDFGTGYSSLTYLRRLPAELIKIDQSFVRGMLADPEDRLIVGGVVGLANAFQRRVIGEGVETVEHGEMLLSLGCDLAQGYGIARPMPAADIPSWTKAWRPDPAWTR
jgi:diguanylate cyclase (GGDEF)-like protein/PAS domain S-box-containing protein